MRDLDASALMLVLYSRWALRVSVTLPTRWRYTSVPFSLAVECQKKTYILDALAVHIECFGVHFYYCMQGVMHKQDKWVVNRVDNAKSYVSTFFSSSKYDNFTRGIVIFTCIVLGPKSEVYMLLFSISCLNFEIPFCYSPSMFPILSQSISWAMWVLWMPQKYLLEKQAAVDSDGGKSLNEDNDLRSVSLEFTATIVALLPVQGRNLFSLLLQVLQYLLDDVTDFLS